jgi:rubrerythrin
MKLLSQMTSDEIVREAIRWEETMLKFYQRVLHDVSSDAQVVVLQLCSQQKERIAQLETLLENLEELRELTDAIAD